MATDEHKARGQAQAQGGKGTRAAHCLIYGDENPREPINGERCGVTLPKNEKRGQGIAPGANGCRPKGEGKDAAEEKIRAKPRDNRGKQLCPGENYGRCGEALQEE